MGFVRRARQTKYDGGVRKLLPFGALGAAVLVIVVAVPSCKTATAIRAHYTTDFGCKDGYLERKVMFSVSRTGEALVFDGRDPNDADSCVPGPRATVGDGQGLVLRPNESANPRYDGTYELVAIVGTDGTTEASCNLGPDGKPKGDLGGEKCVVARRKVRFVSGSEVTQNVFLSSRCAGVLCPEGRTCNPATRLCAEVTENVEDESGSNQTVPETDGGAPALDAGLDATIEPPSDGSVKVDAGMPVCAPAANLTCLGGARVFIGSSTTMPKVVASGGRAAWIEGTEIKEGTFGVDSGGPAIVAKPSALAIPLFLAYSTIGVRANALVGAFRTGGTSDGLDEVHTYNAGAWSLMGTLGGSITALATNGSLLGGMTNTRGGFGAAFAFDGAAVLETWTETPYNPTIVPMVATKGATTSLVYGAGTDTYSATPKEKSTTTIAGALPSGVAVSRLVTYTPDERLVVVTASNGTDGSTLVLLEPGIQAAVTSHILATRVVDVAADANRIYVVRSLPDTRSATELVSIRKAGLSASANETCRITTSDALPVRAITLDDGCLYPTYGVARLVGNSADYSVGRLPKVN